MQKRVIEGRESISDVAFVHISTPFGIPGSFGRIFVTFGNGEIFSKSKMGLLGQSSTAISNPKPFPPG